MCENIFHLYHWYVPEVISVRNDFSFVPMERSNTVPMLKKLTIGTKVTFFGHINFWVFQWNSSNTEPKPVPMYVLDTENIEKHGSKISSKKALEDRLN